MTTQRSDLKMRRQPVQARGRNRLELLHSATERLILEKGLTGFSVREVLRETDTNIATFYQYFPNQKALVRSIVEKHIEQLSHLVSSAFSKADPTDIQGSLSAVQDTILEYYRANPVTRKIWPGVHADNALSATDTADTERNSEAILRFFRLAAPNANAKELEAIARVTAFASGTVYRDALSLPEGDGEAVLSAYLEMIASAVERLREKAG